MKQCKSCKNEFEESEFYKSSKTFLASYCKSCTITKRLEWRKSKFKNKVCASCDKPRLKHTSLCLYHWCRNLIDHQRMNAKIGSDTHKLTLQLLGKLSNQRFKCKYSGLRLIPGLNASLDHIDPYCKSKNYSLENLCWVDLTLNRMKGSKSVEEAMFKFDSYVELFKEYHNGN